MNDVLDIIRTQRPSPPPLDIEARNRIRSRMTGRLEPVVPDRPAESRTSPHDGAVRPSARRHWASIAAVFIVGLGLAALIVAATRPEATVPAVPPPATLDTVPAVEEMPDPAASTTQPAVAAPTDAITPTSEAIAVPAAWFTPVLLAQPPDGYWLAEARYQPGEGGIGIARYLHPQHDTQLQILVRNASAMFEGLEGRPEWQIGDHVFVDDNQGEGCLPDVCSIGTMWDDHTYASLMWVDPNGGDLVAGADRDALLALAPQLVAAGESWLPITDSIEIEPFSEGDETLLLPPDSMVIDTADALTHGLPGGRSAVLRAPDGTMHVLWQSPVRSGTPAEPTFADRRAVGPIEWSGDASAQVALYDAGLPCAYLRIGDGGAGSGAGLWREEIVDLIGAVSTDDGTTIVRLPDGWSRVGGAFGEPIYEVSFVLDVVPDDQAALSVSVTLDQSPGTSGGAIPDTASPRIESADFLGSAGWVATDPAQPEFVGVAWFDGLTSRYVALTAPAGVEATTLLDELEAELSGWSTAPPSAWLQTVGASPVSPEHPDRETDACRSSELVVLSRPS